MTEPPATAVARILNRAGVSAAPVSWLRALSIHSGEEYENYDLDLIGPRQRRRLVRALESAGFRSLTGSRLQLDELIVAFPRPKRTLGTDPAVEARGALRREGELVMMTPTQTLLLALEAEMGAAPPAELEALVYELPANLDKVAQWARAGGRGDQFAALRPGLAAAQKRGTQDRKERSFRSKLPR